jgi:acyl-ACP thioesterase
MTQKYFEEFYEIRTYECDYKGRVSPLSVFDFMQDLASKHADMLGFSVQALMLKKMTWVLSRIHLKFAGETYWGDKLLGRTWPSGTQGKYALRDFQFFNKDNQMIAVGTSSWMVIDLEKRIPLTFEKVLDTTHIINMERALPDEFQPLPVLCSHDSEKEFHVRYSDLDVNKHVNHVAYIDWGLEVIPESVLLHSYPAEIEVGYRREVFYDDLVISRAKRGEGGDNMIFIHQIFSGRKEAEIARMRTKWK